MTEIHKHLIEIFDQGTIYFVTEESLSRGRSTEDVCREALQSGVRMIQLRDKSLTKRKRLEKAYILREQTRKHGALFFVDDEVDIALLAGADGVHLGLDDLPVGEVKKKFPDLLVGASAHNLAEARMAEEHGADYINIGPIYPTNTKKWDKDFLGLDKLKEISGKVNIPYTVMGGIKQDKIKELVLHGARICSVVTAISGADNIRNSSSQLVRELKEALA